MSSWAKQPSSRLGSSIVTNVATAQVNVSQTTLRSALNKLLQCIEDKP
jgi:hypothetical protein